jgi:hypothetical protein
MAEDYGNNIVVMLHRVPQKLAGPSFPNLRGSSFRRSNKTFAVWGKIRHGMGIFSVLNFPDEIP